MDRMIILFCTLNTVGNAMDGNPHLCKSPSQAGGLSFVELGDVGSAAAVQFSCQSCNGISPPYPRAAKETIVQVPRSDYLPTDEAPGQRCYLPVALREGYMFAQLGIKNKASHDDLLLIH